LDREAYERRDAFVPQRGDGREARVERHLESLEAATQREALA
jgi:hypothetical protein